MDLNLKGCLGFFQDKNFRWTFKSHKGIFVPVIDNNKIIGLRIHLNDMYSTDTTDIWFSSSNKNNGTKANNNIMVLLPKENIFHVVGKNTNKKDIIIVSEMILAYKIFMKYKDIIVVGAPNIIPKSEVRKIDAIDNVDTIYLIMDKHTALHTSNTIFRTVTDKYGEDKTVLNFSLNEGEIPQKIDDIFSKEFYSERLA